MAIVGSAKVANTSEWSLSEDKDGKKNVTVPYLVETDDPADGPLTVLGATGLPALNSTLSAGNDTDTSLFCTSRKPSKRDPFGKIWVVTCEFSAEAQENKQDDSGEGTDDPEQWQPDIEITSVGGSKPVLNAILLPKQGQFILGRGNGEPGPIVNSAGQIIRPMPTMDDDRLQIRFSRYHKTLDGLNLQTLMHRVNADNFVIQKFYNGRLVFNMPVLIGQLKVMGMSNRLEIHTVDGVTDMYNKLSLTVAIDPLGWTRKFVDRGKMAKAHGGDLDGRCAEVPYVSGGPDFVEGEACKGTAPLRFIRGKDGHPVEDALLNGAGAPLSEEKINEGVVTELEYQIYTPFNLGWLFGYQPPAPAE